MEYLKYTFLYDLIFPFIQIIQTLNWLLSNKHLPVPHFIKQHIIKDYGKKYQIKTLIETGTYLGTMVNATKDNFKKIYTIELDEKLYNHAKNKFKKFNNIKVFWGDSTIVLPKIIKEINESCLFWLDAHFSKGITAKGIKETPIMDELNSILNHRVKTHVVLIDDANAFTGEKDYPALSSLKKIIFEKYHGLALKIEYNILIVTPKKQIRQ